MRVLCYLGGRECVSSATQRVAETDRKENSPHCLAQCSQCPALSVPPVMDFSFVSDDKPKEQLQRSLPRVTETYCGDDCPHNTVEEPRSTTPEMPAVSAFFSLAALAEVAAMENVHR